ncbi:hypothetical protein HK100_009187, partial [Physocladia obscura]
KKTMSSIKMIGLVLLGACAYTAVQAQTDGASAAELACVNSALQSLPACFQSCLAAQGVSLPLTVDTLTAAEATFSDTAFATCVGNGCTSEADITQLGNFETSLAACVGVSLTSYDTAILGGLATTTTAASTSTTTTSTKTSAAFALPALFGAASLLAATLL